MEQSRIEVDSGQTYDFIERDKDWYLRMVRKYETHEPDSIHIGLYNFSVDAKRPKHLQFARLTEAKARQICLDLIKKGTKHIRVYNVGFHGTHRGCVNYVYPGQLYLHPHTWLSKPKFTKKARLMADFYD